MNAKTQSFKTAKMLLEFTCTCFQRNLGLFCLKLKTKHSVPFSKGAVELRRQ